MGVVGCAEGDSFEEELELRSSRSTGGSRWGCQTCGFVNSPRTGTFLLSNFGVGMPGVGAGLTALEDPWFNRVDAEVDEFGDFVALDPNGKTTIGANLIGWKLIFWDPDSQTEYAVEIYDHELVPNWFDGSLMPTYGLGRVSAQRPGSGADERLPRHARAGYDRRPDARADRGRGHLGADPRPG